jgi:hypothetical protein
LAGRFQPEDADGCGGGMMFKDLIAINNIDRKKAIFRAETRYASDDMSIYSLPEVVIVKNDAGRTLFNEFARRLDYREKNAQPIRDGAAFPVYMLRVSLITAGCCFGLWEQFPSLDELAKEIMLDEMKDDFAPFAEELRLTLK